MVSEPTGCQWGSALNGWFPAKFHWTSGLFLLYWVLSVRTNSRLTCHDFWINYTQLNARVTVEKITRSKVWWCHFLYACVRCHKIKGFGVLAVLPTALSCLNSIRKPWRPSLSFLFSAGSSFPTPAFSQTRRARVTNKCKCDEIAVTSPPPPNGVPPPFERPVSKHILKQIYNSSAPPLNLPWPPVRALLS